jgi:hypothetical protein
VGPARRGSSMEATVVAVIIGPFSGEGLAGGGPVPTL